MSNHAPKKRKNAATIPAVTLPEDAHLYIGGVLVLRYFPDGSLQAPMCPEKRAMVRRYLSRFLVELEARS